MRKMYIIFVLFLILSFAHSYSWITNFSHCNEYVSVANFGFSTILFHASNGTIFSGTPSSCLTYYPPYWSDACSRIMVDNGGHVYVWGGYPYWTTAITDPIPCTSSSCTYLVETQNMGGSSLFNATMTFPVYFGCDTPTLQIVNSYPSTIMSDRYRLNFTIENSFGWSGITCTLSLNGTNKYSTTFNSNGSLDILYSDYPKEFTIAKVTCTYLNGNNNSVIFADTSIILDNVVQYRIADLEGNVGNLTINPPYLYPQDKLDTIGFRLVSQIDNSEYGQAVNILVTSSADLTALGCTGNINKSDFGIESQPISMNNNAYFVNYMLLAIPVACQNPTNMSINIAVSDAMTGQSVDSLNYNIDWVGGNMVIDNVNLIRSMHNGSLQLFAAVSKDYSKEYVNAGNVGAINLSCNYTIYPYYGGPVLAGALIPYIENGFNEENYPEVMADLNVLNSTFTEDPANAGYYGYGIMYETNITCMANNYTTKEAININWIGYRRVAQFSCVSECSSTVCYGEGFSPNHYNVYYSVPTLSDSASISCLFRIDTTLDANANASEEILLANIVAGLRTQVTLDQNINNNIFSHCKQAINWIWEGPSVFGSPVNNYMFAAAFVRKDSDTCDSWTLYPMKVSENMVEVHATYGGNATSFVTPVMADLTFNLLPTVHLKHLSTVLSLLNNTPSNQNIVEVGNTIMCKTTYQDATNQIIGQPVHVFYNNMGQGCAISSHYADDLVNGTKTYTSLVDVTTNSCPFFASSSIGTIKCSAVIYEYNTINGMGLVYYSNALQYKGLVPAGPPQNNTGINLWNDLVGGDCSQNGSYSPLCLAEKLLQDDPVKFILLVLGMIILMPIFIYGTYFAFTLLVMLMGRRKEG